MSFKREGDDKNWLDVLRRRRVSELLALDIPEDEAFLMSNGKYACMVCSWRPVFDTLETLSLHRGGKKHQQSSATVEEKKRQLQDLIVKRKQSEENGELNIQQCSGTSNNKSNSLLSSAPYVARIQRHKKRPYERRQIVDLDKASLNEVEKMSISSCINSIQSTADYNKLVSAVKRNSVPCQPYQKRNDRIQQQFSSSSKAPNSSCQLNISNSQAINNPNHNILSNLTSDAPANINSALTSNFCYKSFSKESAAQTPYSKASFNLNTVQSTSKTAWPLVETPAPVSAIREQTSLAQRYLHARGSGWIRTANGGWCKEDGVEFDSDEEPPSLP